MRPNILILIAAGAAIATLVGVLAVRNPGALTNDADKASLISLVGFLALVGSGILAAPRLNLKGAIRNVVIWGLIAIVVFAAYALRDDFRRAARLLGAELTPADAVESIPGAIEIRRGTDGHFHLNASVDGTLVRFLVDTGASLVTLSRADAERVGIDVGGLDFDRRFQTASGTTRGATVRLGEIAAGSLRVQNVRAAVLEGEGASSLLGMSYLERLGSFEVEGDRMILRR